MSITEQIFNTPGEFGAPSEYEVYARLTDELAVREANGITGADTDEIREAIEEQDERWAEESRAEIWAESAWLRHAEGGWDALQDSRW